MPQRCLFILILFFFVCEPVSAQSSVNGRIYETNDSLIAAATIRNKNRKITTRSDYEGRYSIFADEGDTLLITATGFIPDTITVQFNMLLTQYDITMTRISILMEDVNVRSSYRQDSIDRHIFYAEALKKQHVVTRPPNGFGISFSPTKAFSKAAREKRDLKKRILKEDQDAYIDMSFPQEWVARLTGLKDEELSQFMFRYRPSYIFCRKTDRSGMIIYINDKLKEFRKK